MAKLLPLLAIVALLGLVSVAHAQSMDPTVSTIAITSDPGMDNTYTTLDTITVGVTFSEAVTVDTTNGTPQITLNIGDTERAADYSGDGSSAATHSFSYTVQPVDQDDDGIAVKVNSLALNGGTIRASDDSTDATLTHSAMTFANHKVDTELVLIGNMDQADGTPLRINAGESIRLTFRYEHSIVLYDLNQIVLDVKTASDTLSLAVTTKISSNVITASDIFTTFTGSVSAAGEQAFRSSDFTTKSNDVFFLSGTVEMTLAASGTGFIELGTTASTAEDAESAYKWSTGDSVYRSTNGGAYSLLGSAHIPRFNIVGHTTETLRILAARIVSDPYNGTAYAAGEEIQVLVVLSGPVRVLSDSLTVPLHFGNGAQNRRNASQVHVISAYHSGRLHPELPRIRRSAVQFAYTVQSGDMDADGVVLGADPLGSASDGNVEYAPDTRVKMDLSFPEVGPNVSHHVDGSATHVCDAVYCAYITAGLRDLTYGETVGFERGLTPGEEVGSLSDNSFMFGGQTYFWARNTVYYDDPAKDGTGESEIDVTLVQYLQDRAVQRLGFQVGENMFAFADAIRSRLTRPMTEEFGFEYPDFSYWSNTGLRWHNGDRVLIKIVELPVTATFDAASYTATEGDTFDVTVTLGDSFEQRL